VLKTEIFHLNIVSWKAWDGVEWDMFVDDMIMSESSLIFLLPAWTILAAAILMIFL
jgi:hypothetical protein